MFEFIDKKHFIKLYIFPKLVIFLTQPNSLDLTSQTRAMPPKFNALFPFLKDSSIYLSFMGR